jgi:hypothetical protein
MAQSSATNSPTQAPHWWFVAELAAPNETVGTDPGVAIHATGAKLLYNCAPMGVMRTRQRENRLGAVASAMVALAAILAACSSGTITSEIAFILLINPLKPPKPPTSAFTAVAASPCLMKRPELMDASTRRFVEALLSPPPRDNWTRKLKATPLRIPMTRGKANASMKPINEIITRPDLLRRTESRGRATCCSVARSTGSSESVDARGLWPLCLGACSLTDTSVGSDTCASQAACS